MRSTCIALLLLISLSARGQRLANCYEAVDESRESFCFFDETKFLWRQGNSSGYGTFKADKDSVVLNFESVQRVYDLQLSESQPNNTINSHIEIRAMFSNGQPIPGVRVNLLYSRVNTETDDRGIARIDLIDPQLNDKISIHFNKDFSLPIDVKLRGFDSVFGIVVDDVKYQENQKVSLPLTKQKRKKIKLNGVIFKKKRGSIS